MPWGGGARGFSPLKVKKITPLQTDQNNVIMKNKFIKNEASMKKSFTLAEVLITLGIIGVVAAMTLPTLVQNYKEQETVTRVKKFYSVIAQAYKLAVLENGPFDTWGLEDSVSEVDDDGNTSHSENSLKQYDLFIQKLKPYLKNVKYEKVNDDKTNNTNTRGLVLIDGTSIAAMWLKPSRCSANPLNSCGDFYIVTDSGQMRDKNGKIRNRVFAFQIYKEQILPYPPYTDLNKMFKDSCLSGENYSRCTPWVIVNSNMDYLHCNDLDWNGKTKCSR